MLELFPGTDEAISEDLDVVSATADDAPEPTPKPSLVSIPIVHEVSPGLTEGECRIG